MKCTTVQLQQVTALYCDTNGSFVPYRYSEYEYFVPVSVFLRICPKYLTDQVNFK